MLDVAERKNQILSLIASRGWSIYKLAKKAGLPHHQVYRIANAPQIPDGIEYKTLRTLADALEVDLGELEKEE